MTQLYPLTSFPSSAETLLRASLTGMKKPGTTLPDKGYTLQNVGIDDKQFQAFCKMFGYQTDTVPSTYWYIRLFSIQSLLMAHPDAPFPMPGTVHLYFKINQTATILPSDHLDATCQFGELIQHEKGTITEIILNLKKDGETVWEQRNYNLYMGKKGLGVPAEVKPDIELTENHRVLPWKLTSKNAIDYAKVSGDFNPIHLHNLTAKLFGFPKQLIHGWYTLSRAVAPLQAHIKGAHEIYGSFKKPLFLPSKVLWRAQETKEMTLFDVINEKEKFPHLKGYIQKK